MTDTDTWLHGGGGALAIAKVSITFGQGAVIGIRVIEHLCVRHWHKHGDQQGAHEHECGCDGRHDDNDPSGSSYNLGEEKTTDATECQSTTMLGREDKNTHINDGHHR